MRFTAGLQGAIVGIALLVTSGYTQDIRLDHPAALADGEAAISVLALPANLRIQGATLLEALIALERSSGVRLAYSPSLLPARRRVDCACARNTVGQALHEILDGTGLVHRENGPHVVILPAATLLVVDSPSAGQHPRRGRRSTLAGARRPATTVAETPEPQALGRVVGRVLDGRTLLPITGGQVFSSDTLAVAMTEPGGGFDLGDLPAGRRTVTVRSIGFRPESREVEVAPGDTTHVEFTLSIDAIHLDEVIAIGYGTARRRDVAGAIASVGVERILAGRGAPSLSITGAVLGRAPGVHVVSNAATPGASAVIRIRGTNSITASSAPLYVVDGIPLTQEISASLDPTNIESIQILKDAASTAIYGARGSNGVVLITTSRGTPGDDRIRLEFSHGYQKPAKFIPALNSRQFMELVNEGSVNAGWGPIYSAEEIGGAPYFDYPRALLNDLAWQPQASRTLTFSGGDAVSRYLVSASHTQQTGVVLNSGFERFGARINVDRQLSPRVRMGVSLSGTRSVQRINGSESAGGIGNRTTGLTAAIMYNPTVLPADPVTGELNRNVVMKEHFINPYNESLLRDQPVFRTMLLGMFYGEWDVLPGLVLRSTLGGNFNYEREKSFLPRTIASGQGVGIARQRSDEWRDLTAESVLTFARQIGRGYFQGMVGASVQSSAHESLGVAVRNLGIDAVGYHDLGLGAEVEPPVSTEEEAVIVSQLARVHYSLMDRYLFTLTTRRDGSSRFGAANKWALFPSIAFAWRISDEPFMMGQSFLSDLRLRLSVGRTGNQAIGIGQTLARLSTASTATGNGDVVITLLPSATAPNRQLRWETQVQFNAGMDIGMADDRVAITLDAYQSNTHDLLLDRSLPWTSGFASQTQNIGRVRNRGLELSINTVNVQTPNLFWETSFNVAANRNQVVELYDGLTALSAGSSTQVGEPLGTFVGHRVLGLYQEGDDCELVNAALCAPGEYRLLDADGNGVIDNDDRVNLGSPEPKLFGGFRSSFRVGPVTAEAFFNYSYGNRIHNSSMRYLGLVGGASNERADRALRRWTPANPNTDVPRANMLRDDSRTYSTYIEDGSFLRLQLLSLAYRLPDRLLPGVSSARLLVSAQNLLTLTRYSGYDPESGAVDAGGYPRARSWNVAVDLAF